MNLVINDLDMPLIIKVASIPKERMQVYFIDNEDYFKRKATFADEEGNLFPDNDERAIFFAKGVIETVKKLNWSPDIIHVHGWLASFLPLYLKVYYNNEPLFENSKIVTSVYNHGFDGSLNKDLINKIKFDGIDKESLNALSTPNYVNLMKVAVEHSDAAIIASNELPKELEDYLKELEKPVLKYHNMEEFSQAYLDFYRSQVLID
jgi:starch synthase